MGLQIVRSPVLVRVSKGVISPSFGYLATKLVKEADVIHLHLPQFDAAGVALRGRIFGKPSVITYHCDLKMPPDFSIHFVNQVVHVMNHLAARFTNKIITYTQDYADHSPYLKHYKKKTAIIQPPVILPVAALGTAKEFAEKYDLRSRGPVIGMAARFATEKGVEVLLDALPDILRQFPKAIVLFAGQYMKVLGEDAYAARLFPKDQPIHQRWQLALAGSVDPKGDGCFLPKPGCHHSSKFELNRILRVGADRRDDEWCTGHRIQPAWGAPASKNDRDG